MRKLFVLALCVLIPMAVAARGAAEDETAETTTLTFAWFTDGPDQPAIEALVAEYEELNPDVEIDFSIVPFAELNQLLRTQATAGQAPDLARVTEPYRFTEFGLDLRPYLPSDFASQFLSQPMDLVTGAGGEIYGFPYDLTMNGPFINVTLFEQAGVEIPTGDVPWETWFELAEQVRDATGVPYAVAADRSGHRLVGIVQSFGGSYFTPAGDLNLGDARTRDALRYFVDLHHDGVMPLEIWAGGSGYVGANQQFVNGQLVMYVSGNWQVAQFAETIGDRFEWMAIPNGVNVQSGGMPGGKLIMAFADTDHPQEVADLIAFLSSREKMAQFASQSMFLPTRLDLLEEGVEYPVRSDVMNTFLAGLSRLPDSAFVDNYNQRFGAVANIVRDRVTQAITEEVEFDEAMRLAEREAADAIR